MEQTTALAIKEKDLSIVKSNEVQAMIGQYNILVELAQSVMAKDRDFGIIPGVAKPSLFKPGAEKLRLTFGLETKTELVREIFDIDKPYLDFTYMTSVYHPKTGKLMGQCEGNANSYEVKFRYIWIPEHKLPAGMDKEKLESKSSSVFEFKFAVAKKETAGKYGKPANYWARFEEAIQSGRAKAVKKETSRGMQDGWEIATIQYRIPNPDIVGLKNTLMKMAQKRSFVGAVMLTTGASEFFTQDVEDMEIIQTGEYEVVVEPEKKEPESDAVKEATKKVEKETGMDLTDREELVKQKASPLMNDEPKPKGKPGRKPKDDKSKPLAESVGEVLKDRNKGEEQIGELTSVVNIYTKIEKCKTHQQLNDLYNTDANTFIDDDKIMEAFKARRNVLTESLLNDYIAIIKGLATVEEIAKIRGEIMKNKYIKQEAQETLNGLLNRQKEKIG